MLVVKEKQSTWMEQACYLFKRATGIGVYPDFLILGGQKCGTTSLFGALIQHPDIVRPRKKEPNYFSYRHARRTAWYRANFPSFPVKAAYRLLGRRFQTFEASTNYLFHPRAPERAHAQLPDAKLIALLREPAARAFSHFKMNVREGIETLGFEEAIAREDERMANEREKLGADYCDGLPFRRFSYKTRGLYVDQLAAWTRFYPRERLLVLQMETLMREPQATLDRVMDFLELPRWTGFELKSENVGGYKERMSDATREQLLAYFRPHNERLWQWLGERWDWD